jgi:hypothetical protein
VISRDHGASLGCCRVLLERRRLFIRVLQIVTKNASTAGGGTPRVPVAPAIGN